ncbi:carboxypeptidase-like regulatory domain-containing protein [Pedobacter sp. PWIIR3]
MPPRSLFKIPLLRCHITKIIGIFVLVLGLALAISPSVFAQQVALNECVHLHTDRSSYAIGDTIWFKGYITTGTMQQKSALSKVLYIDLINEKDSIQKNLKLEIVNGTVYGNFAITGDMEEGLIRLRAYTKWMRNFSDDYFFDKTILLFNPYTKELAATPSYDYKTTEGVSSLSTKIKFTNPDGTKMANTQVGYSLMANHETAVKGSTKTDAEGMLIVNIPAKSSNTAVSTYLETSTVFKNQQGISKSFSINAPLKDIDVQFLPEGGSLIYGRPSKVGFKAIGIDGRGLAITGTLVDDQGKKLAAIKSQFAGMGSFTFTPETGRTYSVLIDNQPIKQRQYALPQIKSQGYALAVTQGNDSVYVKIYGVSATITDSLKLKISSGSYVIAMKSVAQKAINSQLAFSKNDFPYGISQISLITGLGQIASQRIVFIKNAKKLDLSFAADKATADYANVNGYAFPTNQPIKLSIKALEAGKIDTSANLSVAVSREEFQIKEQDESTIYTSLLLSPELNGYIESPNYYFLSDSANTDEALDNLMLTQGYRDYTPLTAISSLLKGSRTPSVADLALSTLPKEIHFWPEIKGMDVAGIAKNNNGSVAGNARVTLLSLNAGIMEEVMSGPDGRFAIDSLNFLNGTKFTVQAKYPENTKKIRVTMFNAYPQPVAVSRNAASIPMFYPEQSTLPTENSELPLASRSRALKEVSIQSKAGDKIVYARQAGLQIPEGSSDQTIYLNSPEKCANLGICLNGLAAGIVFKPYQSVMSYPFFRDSAMNVILNGRLVTDSIEIAGIFDNNVVQPDDIGRIEVVRTNLAIINSLTTNSRPAILILTKRNYNNLDTYIPDFTYYIPEGYSQTPNLYIPKYSYEGTNTLKSSVYTLYWDSNVHPDQNGKVDLELTSQAPTGFYRVTIEGISSTGAVGRKTFRFSVK